jgi:hypothetical protein
MESVTELKQTYNLEEEETRLASAESNIASTYPMGLLVDMAEKLGIDVQGKDRSQLAKEIFLHKEKESATKISEKILYY